MANKATTVFTISAEDKTKAGIQSAQSSFKEFTSTIDSITGGMASKVGNLITNPWTAAAAAIGVGVKVTKELWSAGLEAEKGALAMKQAWGTAADTISAYVSEVDRTTLATKEDLEGMAESLSQYGFSAEEVKGILQTTADIATQTGKSFSNVETAIVNALNGQETALKKIIPEWENYSQGAEDAKTGILNLGDAIHNSTIQVQSGSIAQTLDNMSSSWQNIKDNLGQTIVMDIEASGILLTIAKWLERIEKNTAAEYQGKRVNAYTGSIVDQFNTKGSIDWANLPKDFDDTDIPLILSYLESHPELYTTEKESRNRIIGGYTTSPDYDSFFQDLMKNNTESFILSNGIDVLYDYYKKNGADDFFRYRFQDFAKSNGGFQLGVVSSPWYKDEVKKYTETDAGYLFFKGYLEDRLANPQNYGKDGLYSPVSSTPSTTSTPTATSVGSQKSDLDKWYETYNSYLNGSTTFWEDGSVKSTLTWVERITSRNWEGLEDSDWDNYLKIISKCPDGAKKENLINGYREDRLAYELWKSAGTSTPTIIEDPYAKHWNDYAEHMAKRDKIQSIDNQIAAQLASQAKPETVKTLQEIINEELKAKLGELPVNDADNPYGDRKSYTMANHWNAMAGRYESDDGNWFYNEDENKWFSILDENEKKQLEAQAQADQAKAERDAQIIKNIQLATQAVNTLQNVMSMWGDGKYQSGEVGSGISAIGGLVSNFAPVWGAGITLAGAGIGFLESLFSKEDKDSESSNANTNAAQIAQYNGATTIHINNYFDGANIVGSGGMEELARIMRDELDGLSYANR